MDPRHHIERAYAAALAVVEAHDNQHYAPYQLASHMHRARREHLAELETEAPFVGAQAEHVAHDALAAAEHHPEDAVIDWHAQGRRAAEAGADRTAPAGKHPRTAEAREWFAGYDEARAEAAAAEAAGR
jgi:hypothetical protein